MPRGMGLLPPRMAARMSSFTTRASSETVTSLSRKANSWSSTLARGRRGSTRLKFRRSKIRRQVFQRPSSPPGEGGLSFCHLYFFPAGQRFDGALADQGVGAVPAGLVVEEFYRATGSGITGPLAVVVLAEAAGDVVRDPGVKCAIIAFEDVEEPGLGFAVVGQTL